MQNNTLNYNVELSFSENENIIMYWLLINLQIDNPDKFFREVFEIGFTTIYADFFTEENREAIMKLLSNPTLNIEDEVKQ